MLNEIERFELFALVPTQQALQWAEVYAYRGEQRARGEIRKKIATGELSTRHGANVRLTLAPCTPRSLRLAQLAAHRARLLFQNLSELTHASANLQRINGGKANLQSVRLRRSFEVATE